MCADSLKLNPLSLTLNQKSLAAAAVAAAAADFIAAWVEGREEVTKAVCCEERSKFWT